MTGYISTIPDGPDNLSTSQGQMKTNFGVLQSLYAVDHAGWTDATATGKHKQVTFYQVAAPGAQVNPASIAYTKLVSSVPELYFRNTSTTGIQITNGTDAIWKGGTTIATGVIASNLAANGYIKFPNGLMLQWGTVLSVSSGDQAFSPTFTGTPFTIQTTPIRNTSSIPGGAACIPYRVDGTETTNAKFSWRFISGSGNYAGFTWLAIGV